MKAKITKDPSVSFIAQQRDTTRRGAPRKRWRMVLCALLLALATRHATQHALARPSMPQSATPQPLPVVSLMSLITRPEKYDGKRVVVAGYATFGFEHSYLYLSPYDAQYSIDENAVWLEIDDKRFPNWRSLDHQTVEVEGTFHVPKGAAYWTNYPNGYIGEITHLQLSDPPGRFFGF
jgi:hypothetical protein